MVFVEKYKKKKNRGRGKIEDVWMLTFKDKYGNRIGRDMLLENWIKSQGSRYEPDYIKKFLEKHDKFWW